LQKRLARKLDLEMLLSRVKPHPTPSPHLEQYTISADVAANMLYIAAYANSDIVDRTVLDLGCGTGRLALAAAFLGAKCVVGVDIDEIAVRTARQNAVETDLAEKTQWVVGDIDVVSGVFNTVLQNPPFGVQKRGADRKFLERALAVADTVYSLHKSVHDSEALVKRLKATGDGVLQVSTSPFMERYIEKCGGYVKSVYAMVMTIPYMFSFHEKKKHEFVVDMYVTGKRRDS
jgi:putative methylase